MGRTYRDFAQQLLITAFMVCTVRCSTAATTALEEHWRSLIHQAPSLAFVGTGEGPCPEVKFAPVFTTSAEFWVLPVMVQVFSFYLAPAMAFGRAWGGDGQAVRERRVSRKRGKLGEGAFRGGVMPSLNLFAQVLFRV